MRFPFALRSHVALSSGNHPMLTHHHQPCSFPKARLIPFTRLDIQGRLYSQHGPRSIRRNRDDYVKARPVEVLRLPLEKRLTQSERQGRSSSVSRRKTRYPPSRKGRASSQIDASSPWRIGWRSTAIARQSFNLAVLCFQKQAWERSFRAGRFVLWHRRRCCKMRTWAVRAPSIDGGRSFSPTHKITCWTRMRRRSIGNPRSRRSTAAQP